MFDRLETAAQRIANLIGEGKYGGVLQACSNSRLSEADLERILRDYGRTPMRAPIAPSQYVDIVEIEGRPNTTCSVCVPIWTVEEGRSDLTLVLTIIDELGEPKIELDDLRVL